MGGQDQHNVSLLAQQQQLNLSTLNTTVQGGNLNLTMNKQQPGSGLNTTFTKSLISTLTNSCGVELPIIIDLLLLNKADGSVLLGAQQHVYNFTPIIPPSPIKPGLLYSFYPVDIIATMIQLVIARDRQ